MQKKIIFIVPSLNDSHYKNRILDFMQYGYEVVVYGYARRSINTLSIPYSFNVLGYVEDSKFLKRIPLYIKSFNKIFKNSSSNSVFYIGGLDLALCFRFFHLRAKYIYEECDLVHTYLGYGVRIFEWLDKWIIRNSLLTIFTSQGFIKYHFGNKTPNNIILVENKLNPSIKSYSISTKKELNLNHMSIGFVGAPRFDSVFHFIDVFCKQFPQHEFHIFGGPVVKPFPQLQKYPNCIFHGFFKNPDDLPTIYKQIDMVLCTYDIKYENVKYAEPNKLYEAIYFETPIIVSSSTFLAEKVDSLGIGYKLDPLDSDAVVKLINHLSIDDWITKQSACSCIDKKNLINTPKHLFQKLQNLL